MQGRILAIPHLHDLRPPLSAAVRESSLTPLCLVDMLVCMRTTVRLNPQLLEDAKRYAVETGRTLTAVIEDALREALARRERHSEQAPMRLPTFRGDGLRPGVDLDDSAGLLDLMEGR